MKFIIALILNCLLVTNCLAADKPFQEWLYTDSLVSSKCGNARDIKYAVPSDSTCAFAVKIRVFQKPGANLERLAKQYNYHPISFWLEQRIENGKNEWRKVSNTRAYRYNDVFQAIKHQVTKTGIFRIAIDFQGQKAFADDFTIERKVTVQ